MAESFLAADAILNIWRDVAKGIVVHPEMIRAHLVKELPFMATESLLMEAVARGGDRQELHERIRVHSHEAARLLKKGAATNDLFERIRADAAFDVIEGDLGVFLDPKRFIGRAPSQVDEFIDGELMPAIEGIEQDEAEALRV